MKSIVSYKAESTGFAIHREPSDGDNQPHLVRLSAVKFVDGEEVEKFDEIVYPNGWFIPDKTVELHGITQSHAEKSGLHEVEVIDKFLQFCKNSTLITSSKLFNKRMIRIATKRYCDISVSDAWKNNEDHYCVISMAKKRMGMKKLNLAEAAKTYQFQYEHGDSMLDAKTTARIYFLINK